LSSTSFGGSTCRRRRRDGQFTPLAIEDDDDVSEEEDCCSLIHTTNVGNEEVRSTMGNHNTKKEGVCVVCCHCYVVERTLDTIQEHRASSPNAEETTDVVFIIDLLQQQQQQGPLDRGSSSSRVAGSASLSCTMMNPNDTGDND
jgi:hypothetical protein